MISYSEDMHSLAIIAIIVIVAIVMVGAAVLLNGSYSPPVYSSTVYTTVGSSGPSTTTTPVLVTDPPHVPAGTSALVVTYSSVQVQQSGSSGWAQAAGSGSINVLTVVNSSKVIGYATVDAKSSINAVRMYIASATITVNGTTHSVSVPNNVTVSVTGNSGANVNATTGVLIDIGSAISSTTSTNSTTNTTTTIYVLTPSAKAAIIANLSTSIGVGSIVNLSTSTKAGLGISI